MSRKKLFDNACKITLVLRKEQLQEVDTLAHVDGRSRASMLREAIDLYLETRTQMNNDRIEDDSPNNEKEE